MSKFPSIREQYSTRQKGEMSREKYWSNFRDFLREYSEFNELQLAFENKILTKNGSLVVDLKCTNSHASRIQMVLDKEDIRSVPFSVLAEGFYEPFQSDLLVGLGKESHHFLDIGANMGFYSLALAKENPTLEVDSFEPQPAVYRTLNTNIELNELNSKIKVHNVGLGNEVTNLTMYVPSFTGSGGASFRNLHSEEGAATEVMVAVEVLDQLGMRNVDLMKIDVEGSELNVLLGAQSLIQDSKPTVVVELLRKWMKPFSHTPQMFLEHMKVKGYLCFAIGDKCLDEISIIDENTQQTNFIFVHPTQAGHLDFIYKHKA